MSSNGVTVAAAWQPTPHRMRGGGSVIEGDVVATEPVMLQRLESLDALPLIVGGERHANPIFRRMAEGIRQAVAF